MVVPIDQSLVNPQERLFEEELFPHADALYNFAFHLTRNEDDANDLVQETFMKAYRFMGHYQEGTNAKAWLFKILKNAFINLYRKKTKAPGIVDYEDVVSYHDSDDDAYKGNNDLREELFGNLVGDEISMALESLPVDFKTVILLCDLHDFTYEEIAKIIDIPVGTVRSRLHRGRKILEERLANYARTMGYKKKK